MTRVIIYLVVSWQHGYHGILLNKKEDRGGRVVPFLF